MRGNFDRSCGATLSLPGSVAELACASGLARDELTCDEVIEDGISKDVVTEGGCCFAAVTGLVIFGSGCIITLPSCAFFSFHHSPPASSAEITTNTNTSTIPGWCAVECAGSGAVSAFTASSVAGCGSILSSVAST